MSNNEKFDKFDLMKKIDMLQVMKKFDKFQTMKKFDKSQKQLPVRPQKMKKALLPKQIWVKTDVRLLSQEATILR